MKVKCKFIDVGRSKLSWTDDIKTHDGMLSDVDLIRSIRQHNELLDSDIQFNRDFSRSKKESAAWHIWAGTWIVGRVEIVQEAAIAKNDSQ